jgi:hypothetical protein
VRLAAVAIVAGILFAGPAYADERGEAKFRAFLETIESWEGWTASSGAIASEGADTIVSDFTASRSTPPFTVEIERLRLRDLSSRRGSGFSASEADLSGLEMAAEGFALKIPRLATKGLALPDLGDLVFAPRAFFGFRADLFREILDASLAELTIPQIAIELTGPTGQGSSIAYSNVTLGRLGDGILESATAGPIRIASRDQAAGGIDIARAEMATANLSSFAEFFAENAAGSATSRWQPALGSIRYSGIVATGPDAARIAIDEFALEEIQTRTPIEPLAARLDALLAGLGGDEAIETVLETLDALRVGRIRINGVSLKGSPDDPVDIALGAVALKDLSGEGFGAFDLHGFRGTAPGGHVALESMRINGVMFPSFSEGPDVNAFWAEAPAAEREEAIKRLLASFGRFEHFEATGLALGESEAGSVRVGSLTADMAGYVGSLPMKTSVSVDGFTVPGSLLQSQKGGAELLALLGEDRVEIDLTLQDTWNPSAGTDTVALRLSLNDAAAMQVAYSYSGITEAWLYAAIARAADAEGEDFDAVLRILQGLTLDSASVRIDDTSLLDRGFAFAAKRQGLTIDGATYRQQMRGALPFLISAVLPAELSKLLIEPLQAFLGGGQTLVLRAEPAASLPLSSIAGTAEKNPMDLVPLLNVQVEAVPAP